jgi:hypothetical protein
MSTEVERRFTYAKPSQAAIVRMEHVRNLCKMLAVEITTNAPPCRETSIAITKLEEVSMWVNKAIALHGESDPVDVG